MTNMYLLSFDGYFGDMDIEFSDRVLVSQEMLDIVKSMLVIEPDMSMILNTEYYEKEFSISEIFGEKSVKQLDNKGLEVLDSISLESGMIDTVFERLVEIEFLESAEDTQFLGMKFLDAWNKV